MLENFVNNRYSRFNEISTKSTSYYLCQRKGPNLLSGQSGSAILILFTDKTTKQAYLSWGYSLTGYQARQAKHKKLPWLELILVRR